MGIGNFSLGLSRSLKLPLVSTPIQVLTTLFRSTCGGAPARFKQQIRDNEARSASAALRIQSPSPLAIKAIVKSRESARTVNLSDPSHGPVRIVRSLEEDVGQLCAGRMCISGRMADVCAELDRMAQSESTACQN